MSNVLNKFKLGSTIINIEDLQAQTRLDNLAHVATSGSYNDLTDKPTIPPATSGSYNDLKNKPTITYDSTTKTISFNNF